jgi:tetrahydromethanopterin S-methyltransferase subunit E
MTQPIQQPVQQPIQQPVQQPVYGQNTAQGFYGQQPYGYGAQSNPYAQQPAMTRGEFYKNYAAKAIKGNITAAGVLSYITAAITLILSLAVMNDPFLLIDCLLVLGLGLGVHLGRSRVCAVLLMAYAAYNTIFFLITSGMVSGWLIIIAGICALAGTFTFEKAWKQFW